MLIATDKLSEGILSQELQLMESASEVSSALQKANL
jgi:hypothetical protein